MSNERALRRLERQIWELLAWRNLASNPVESWTATGANGEQRNLHTGDRWDDLAHPVRISTVLEAPAPPGSMLDFFAQGDGLVYLDGELAGAISPFEREVSVDEAREIVVEVAPNDSFGEIISPARLVTARIVQPNFAVRALHRALLMPWETCVSLPDQDIVAPLMQAIKRALQLIILPSDEVSVLRRMATLRDELEIELEPARSLHRHYHFSAPLSAIERLLNETMHFDTVDITHLPPASGTPTGVHEAREYLDVRLADLATIFPPIGRLAASSHAHLDVAWLWPLSETRRKIRHTFASVLSLMDRYTAFHFTVSSAQLFQYVQQDDPDLFERVRARVHEGRIEPIGGMWLEPDCNLPHGESLARHVLLGQRYFDREFGRRSRVAWLPDTFGLTGNLPQILAGGGIRYFFTQKLSWNDTNRFPTICGCGRVSTGHASSLTPSKIRSAVTTAWCHPNRSRPRGGISGERPNIPRACLRLEWEMAGVVRPLTCWSASDSGGISGTPPGTTTTVEEFFERIDPAGLPVWLGELYLEFHRGTYTTQARIKRLNRMAEHRLLEAETAATLANLVDDNYPSVELEQNWTTLLRNQFHDILPGSSIRIVNEQAEAGLTEVVRRSSDIRDRAIAQLGDPAQTASGPRRERHHLQPAGIPTPALLRHPSSCRDRRIPARYRGRRRGFLAINR